MTTDIKPIETVYNGYRFRSRLEARWAVFFDALGIKYEYEPEGFDLGEAGWYLPDFLVKSIDGDTWFYEVKPSLDADDGKLNMLVSKSGHYGAVLTGDPYAYVIELGHWPCPRCMQFTGYIRPSDLAYGCVECEPCDRHTPSGGGHPVENHWGFRIYPHKGSVVFKADDDLRRYKELIKNACIVARSARFEHGEQGACV